VLLMRYDFAGGPVGAEPVEDSAQTAALLRTVGELAWFQATPFTSWWDDHREYRRSAREAA